MKQLRSRIFCMMLSWMAAGAGYAQMLPIQLGQNAISPLPGLRENRSTPQANARITEARAVELARQQFTGNILRISLIGEGDNQLYQIRMENEGKVFTVFVHVATGRVSGGT
ncbi:MAG: hypothetical protein EXR84_07360 [Gammaproteobacteria bacterium]|nr:hypothetical protein [Gammaproteobacteria bacterium]